jgi:hypothetical protein
VKCSFRDEVSARCIRFISRWYHALLGMNKRGRNGFSSVLWNNMSQEQRLGMIRSRNLGGIAGKVRGANKKVGTQD